MALNNYSVFMNDFFKKSSLKYKVFDKTLILDNYECNVKNNNINIVITLSENGISGEYVGFMVDIIKKDKGKIVSLWFGFKEYLPFTCKVGTGNENHYYKIVDHCSKDWYGSAPNQKDIDVMVNAMINFIKCWV